MKLRPTEWAYLAGLVDGGGTITLARDNRFGFRYPSVSLSSCTWSLVAVMRRSFGGCICPVKAASPNHSPSWVWDLTRNGALEVLKGLLPYLKEPGKIRRAKFILKYYKLRTAPNWPVYAGDAESQA